MRAFLAQFHDDQSGATAIEYGMIAAVIIGSLQVIGSNLNAQFASISAQLN